MKQDTSFSFGKAAMEINEAYTMMYSPKRGRRLDESVSSRRRRMVSEAEEDGPSKEELLFGGDLSPEQKEYIKNFDAEKEYQSILKAEQREKDAQAAKDAVASGESDKTDLSGLDSGEDDDTRTFMSSFNRGGGREHKSDSDFLLTSQRYHGLHKYPAWLRAAAKAAGHVLPDDDDVPTRYGGHGAKEIKVAKDEDEYSPSDGSDYPSINIWKSVIDAHPEEFNDENYDMEALRRNRERFADIFVELMVKGVSDDVEAAIKAFELIPGCERKNAPEEDDATEGGDVVGNIDDEGSSAIPEFKGYGVIVKKYVPVYVPGEKDSYGADIVYMTPSELKGVEFGTVDDAKNALRDYLSGTDDENVLVGVVIDRELADSNLKGRGGRIVVGPDGRKKVLRRSSSVYKISTSGKAKTDIMMKRAAKNWKKSDLCDEYLDLENSVENG